MKLEDLVVLKFAPNNCFVEVVDVSQIKEKDFKIDLEKKTWLYKGWGNNPIGRARNIRGRFGMEIKSGVIGVYDRNSTEQIDSLVASAQSCTYSKTDMYDSL